MGSHLVSPKKMDIRGFFSGSKQGIKRKAEAGEKKEETMVPIKTLPNGVTWIAAVTSGKEVDKEVTSKKKSSGEGKQSTDAVEKENLDPKADGGSKPGAQSVEDITVLPYARLVER